MANGIISTTSMGNEASTQNTNLTLVQEELTSELAQEKVLGVNNATEVEALVQELKTYRENKQTATDKLKNERDMLKTQYETTVSELNQYKNEKVLMSKGISSEYTDYLVFKISKLVTDKVSFEQATEQFLKDNPKYIQDSFTTVNFGASMSNTVAPKNANEQFNALIRSARK